MWSLTTGRRDHMTWPADVWSIAYKIKIKNQNQNEQWRQQTDQNQNWLKSGLNTPGWEKMTPLNVQES